MANADLAFSNGLELGQTYGATFIEKQLLQGTTRSVENPDPSDKSVPQLKGTVTTYRLVKNSSGGTLASKLNCKWEPESAITAVDGLAGATDLVAGVVDQYLGSATVADGDYFWLAVHGPHLVTSSASYDDNVTLAPAASGKTAASSTPPNAYDFATSINEATAGDQNKLVFLHTKYH